ncbi:hypothetical protein, partial [Alloscardovia sp. HMSC034E08]|uniref:hypothetical protein n=1 Tax=Alloscardovia sp. HMSC034E08 TaxID=1739413 RepID=UPI001AEFD448
LLGNIFCSTPLKTEKLKNLHNPTKSEEPLSLIRLPRIPHVPKHHEELRAPHFVWRFVYTYFLACFARG